MATESRFRHGLEFTAQPPDVGVRVGKSRGTMESPAASMQMGGCLFPPRPQNAQLGQQEARR